MTAIKTGTGLRMGILGWLVALGAGGCAGGQTGGEVGAESGTGGGGAVLDGSSCDEDATELGPNEVSPLGFSAADVLVLAEGSREATLTWIPDEVTSVETTLEPGTTEVTLGVEATGAATFVDASPPSSGSSGGMLDLGWNCPDRVDVPVTVTLITADGAFDERLPGILSATSASSATLGVPIDLDQLEGTFSFEVVSPEGGVPIRTTLEVVFGQGIFAGRLDGTIEMRTASVVSAGGVIYGEWGYGACEQGEYPVDPESPGALTDAAVLDVINGASPLAVTWGDGTETTLSLAAVAKDPTVCWRPASEWLGYPEDRYLVSAAVTMSSADGRLNAEQDVLLEVDATLGAPTAITLRSASAQPVDPADFEATFGLSGVALGDATSAYLTLGLEVLVGDTAVSTAGDLTVYGTPPTDCVDTETSVCGSPGPEPIESMPIESLE